MADALHVELVAADRTVWSGEATRVIARTVEGDVGILKDHAPLLSLLTDATVEIASEEGEIVVAVVDGGFISVAANRVSILSERAVLAEEVKVDEARAELEAAYGLVGKEEDALQRVRRAEARIRAVERAS
jgi:F-type H+-transporting ATPase subunit epsilon